LDESTGKHETVEMSLAYSIFVERA